jgi:hypothetical protein
LRQSNRADDPRWLRKPLVFAEKFRRYYVDTMRKLLALA